MLTATLASKFSTLLQYPLRSLSRSPDLTSTRLCRLRFCFSKMSTQVQLLAETVQHERTYMTWPENDENWGEELLKLVQRDVIAIAEAVVSFEPLTMIVSPEDYATVRKRLNGDIDLLEIPVNDLWARDTLPIFTIDKTRNSVIGVDFNFNGWGGRWVNSTRSFALSKNFLAKVNFEREHSSLVLEGGALETDGAGTLLVTESSILNENRNPGKSKTEVEIELKRVLGVEKIIWFKGVRNGEPTDSHVDCIARFVSPGRVIVSHPCRDIPPERQDSCWAQASAEATEVLQNETDAQGQKFKIIKIFEPHPQKIKMDGNAEDQEYFVSSYANFYVVNGGVIMPKFGDIEADTAAMKVLQNEFPERKIVAVEISALACGGGGIHCATHDLPAKLVR